MIQQLDVFNDAPRARRADPVTSHDAAARVDGGRIARLVLAELEKADGTTHELAERLGLSLVTVSPRLAPLRKRGLVIANGKRDGRTVWRRTQS